MALGGRQLLQHPQLFQGFVGPLRFRRVDTADGKPDVHQHVISQAGLRHKIKGDLSDDTPELYAGGTQRGLLLNLKNFPWNREAHGAVLLSGQYSIAQGGGL